MAFFALQRIHLNIFIPFNVNLAHAFVNGWRRPFYCTIVQKFSFRHYGHLIISIGTIMFDSVNEILMFRIKVKMFHLLYKTISGSHIISAGTYKTLTPPYSSGFHFNFWSIQVWKLFHKFFDSYRVTYYVSVFTCWSQTLVVIIWFFSCLTLKMNVILPLLFW